MKQMKLAFPRLHIDSSAADAVVSWYCKVLGMEIIETFQTSRESIQWLALPHASASAILEFRFCNDKALRQYSPDSATDTYWKIGVALQDVDTGRKRIVENGTPVSQAKQFRDIGYLCHLQDPFGYTIELLQHDFQQNFKGSVESKPERPLGQDSNIGQITLRVNDIEASLAYYQNEVGMKLLSRQSIPGAFDLYFLACTDENPPSEDINSVDIREWLWKRPYTTLELQHYPNTTVNYRTANLETELGFSAMAYFISQDHFDRLVKRSNFQIATSNYPEYETDVLQSYDPDGTQLLFIRRL